MHIDLFTQIETGIIKKKVKKEKGCRIVFIFVLSPLHAFINKCGHEVRAVFLKLVNQNIPFTLAYLAATAC